MLSTPCNVIFDICNLFLFGAWPLDAVRNGCLRVILNCSAGENGLNCLNVLFPPFREALSMGEHKAGLNRDQHTKIHVFTHKLAGPSSSQLVLMFDGEFQKRVAALKSKLARDVGPVIVDCAVMNVQFFGYLFARLVTSDEL